MIPTSAFYTYDTAVTYADLGPDHLLCHRGLLHMLQECATLASKRCTCGLEAKQQRLGGCWVLSGWRLELDQRPPWNTPVSVCTWPRAMDGFTSDREFLVHSGDTLVARASSRWILVDPEVGKITRITPELAAVYELDPRAVFDEPIAKNGVTPPEARETFTLTAGRRDMDTNHHVNNIHYLDYALEALPQGVYDHLPNTVEISYRRQILLGDHIRCLYAQLPDGRHQIELVGDQDGKAVHHAFIWFYNHAPAPDSPDHPPCRNKAAGDSGRISLN